MSTRYVYGIYDTAASKRSDYSVHLATDDYYKKISGYACTKYSLSTAENRYGNPVTHYEIVSDPSYSDRGIASLFNTNASGTQFGRYETSKYKYAVLTVGSGWVNDKWIIDKSYLIELPSTGSAAYWHSKYFQSAFDFWASDSDYWNETPESSSKKLIYISGGDIAQGSTLLSTESSGTSLQTGVFKYGDSYRWRALEGSDNIDPSSVTYSTTSIIPGQPVTINATTRAPSYGGTIYYQFSYSTDGGSSWTDIGGLGTTASASVTVPSGATQFKGRVRASDSWGFISSTYVTGPNLTLARYKVSTSVTPSDGGTVTGAGTYTSGSKVTLEATPNSGYKVEYWERNGRRITEDAEFYTFYVHEETNIIVGFVKTYTVSLSVSPSGSGTVKGSGTYASGSSVTVKATPNSGYKFLYWLDGNSIVSTSPSYQFTISSSVTLTAVFEQEIRGYVGINSKAAELEKGYVGIGCKAKELVKGYVGVGGVANKLF